MTEYYCELCNMIVDDEVIETIHLSDGFVDISVCKWCYDEVK